MDTLLCALLGLPSVMRGDTPMLTLGVCVSTLSVLADASGFVDLLWMDRLFALIMLASWIHIGCAKLKSHPKAAVAALTLATAAIFFWVVGLVHFYVDHRPDLGVVCQRLWHLLAVGAMLLLDHT